MARWCMLDVLAIDCHRFQRLSSSSPDLCAGSAPPTPIPYPISQVQPALSRVGAFVVGFSPLSVGFLQIRCWSNCPMSASAADSSAKGFEAARGCCAQATGATHVDAHASVKSASVRSASSNEVPESTALLKIVPRKEEPLKKARSTMPFEKSAPSNLAPGAYTCEQSRRITGGAPQSSCWSCAEHRNAACWDRAQRAFESCASLKSDLEKSPVAMRAPDKSNPPADESVITHSRKSYRESRAALA